MKLEDILQRFSNDLQAYIAQEVARQVGGYAVETKIAQPSQSLLELQSLSNSAGRQQNNSEVLERLNNDFSGATLRQQSESDFLATLEELRKGTNLVTNNSSAVDALSTEFGAPDKMVKDDSLTNLSKLSKNQTKNGSNISTVDKLVALTVPHQVENQVVATGNPPMLSGLRLLLNKIRQGKNLNIK